MKIARTKDTEPHASKALKYQLSYLWNQSENTYCVVPKWDLLYNRKDCGQEKLEITSRLLTWTLLNWTWLWCNTLKINLHTSQSRSCCCVLLVSLFVRQSFFPYEVFYYQVFLSIYQDKRGFSLSFSSTKSIFHIVVNHCITIHSYCIFYIYVYFGDSYFFA